MSEKSWKEQLDFLSPKGIEHEVQGKKLMFYPISNKILFQLKEVAKPLASAIAALFPDARKDVGTKYDYADDPDVAPGKERLLHMETEGISAQLALLRLDTKEKAIIGIIDALTDSNNALVIGRVIVDSLKDVFERDSMSPQETTKFMENMSIDTLKDMLLGLMKANAKVLGPLGEKVNRLVKLTMEDRLANLEKAKENKPHFQTKEEAEILG